jgi:hypothetical protein
MPVRLKVQLPGVAITAPSARDEIMAGDLVSQAFRFEAMVFIESDFPLNELIAHRPARLTQFLRLGGAECGLANE